MTNLLTITDRQTKAKEEGSTFKRRNAFSTAAKAQCLIDVDENILPCSYFPNRK